MEIKTEKIVKHKVTIIIDKDTYCRLCDRVQKSNGIDEVIAFNVIKRIGSTYQKKLCWVSYRTEARQLGIIDTLEAIGIDDFIRIKLNTQCQGFCVEYSKFDNLWEKPIVNVCFKKE